MRFKLQHVFGLLAVLALLWAGNLWYFYSNQLAKPIFLNHYYDIILHNNSAPMMEIYYLVNRTKPLDLVDFEIPDRPEIRFRILNSDTVETFSHQILKRAHLNIEMDPTRPIQPGTEVAFREARVWFSDNTRLTAPIGQIYLTMVNAPGAQLRWSSAGSSNNNTGFAVLQANREMKVTALHYRFQKQLGDSLHVELNDSEKTFPFTLKQGDSLRLSYRFSFADKDKSLAASYYRINGMLDVQTADGADSTVLVDMHYQPYIQATDVNQLVRRHL